MRKKIIAALLLAALILVPAGLAGATGPDDPVSSEPEPGAGHDEGDVDATPEPVLEDEEEPAPDEEAPDYVRPDEEGEVGITSAEGEDIAEDAELVWALDDEEAAQKSYTWIYLCAGAAVLLLAGVFFYSRKKAKVD